MSRLIVVKAIFDPEANVWYTESSDVHGLRIEAETVDALIERIPGAIQDLLNDGGGDDLEAVDVPVEVIANATTRVRLHLAA